MALNDVLRNLNKVTTDTEKKAERQIKKCCEDLLSKAVDITPIDTGELRKKYDQHRIGSILHPSS